MHLSEDLIFIQLRLKRPHLRRRVLSSFFPYSVLVHKAFLGIRRWLRDNNPAIMYVVTSKGGSLLFAEASKRMRSAKILDLWLLTRRRRWRLQSLHAWLIPDIYFRGRCGPHDRGADSSGESNEAPHIE